MNRFLRHTLVSLAVGLLAAGAASAQVCVSPPPQMDAWWAGDGDATDLLGTFHASAVGGVVFSPGQVDDAFVLDGSTGFVFVGDVLDPGLGDFSVDAWVRVDGPLGLTAFNNIVRKGVTLNESSQRPGFDLGITTTGFLSFGVSDVVDGSVVSAVDPALFPLDGQFHHVAGVLDRGAGQIHLYLDGVLVDSTPIGSLGNIDSAAPLAIGVLDRGSFGVDDGFFPGTIDEVEMFSRALTAVEIAGLFAADSAGKCKVSTVPALRGLGLAGLAAALALVAGRALRS